ncbi:hypothetical protein [Neobacillus notoginsengisoli]|uniref:hypothetical protein n=1 Tax=Neobacillus notoginsengisoli TaxID=1578198 RepID=UPI0018652A63|nr:hypothetical protein [Neobacillus notoginsengisoli]
MNTSLSAFMMMAAVTVIIVALLFGIGFDSLQKKNSEHEQMLKTEHQLKFKK